MKKWILFDLSGVVLEDAFGPEDNVPVNGKIIQPQKFGLFYETETYRLFMLGDATEDEAIADFIRKYGPRLTKSDVKEFLKKERVLTAGMKELISQLKKTYKIACLANEGRELVKYSVDNFHLQDLFDKMIESNTLHLLKPNLNFFIKSLETLEARANECIFIDDEKKNCKAAEEVGMNSILFENVDQLKTELKNLGVNLD